MIVNRPEKRRPGPWSWQADGQAGPVDCCRTLAATVLLSSMFAIIGGPAKAAASEDRYALLSKTIHGIRGAVTSMESLVGPACMDGIVNGTITISIAFAVATIPPTIGALAIGAGVGCSIRSAESWLREDEHAGPNGATILQDTSSFDAPTATRAEMQVSDHPQTAEP